MKLPHMVQNLLLIKDWLRGFVDLWGLQSTEANKLQKKRSTKT